MNDTEPSRREPARRTATVDSYEIAHIRRENHLTGVATLTLLTMTLQVDWRDPWFRLPCSLSELADDTGHTREAIGKAMADLEALGLIAVLRPFQSGRKGVVQVLAYERLVRLSKRQREARASAPFDVLDHQTSRENGQSPGRDIAGTSREVRGGFAGTPTETPRTSFSDSDDVGRGLQGSEGGESYEGPLLTDEDVPPVPEDELCLRCGDPLSGHIFCDHEPVYPAGVAAK